MTGSSPAYIIGIDGGGTKTHCVIGDAQGNLLAACAGDAGNVKSRPWPQVAATFGSLIRQAVRSAGAETDQVAVIAAGLGGVVQPRDRERIARLLQAHAGDGAVIRVYPDAENVLAAGGGGGAGIALIAGTGSVAWGRTAGGSEARSGGWGHVLGDEGSGYDIGRRALGAVIRAHDGRGEPTALTPMLLRHLGLISPTAFIELYYEQAGVRKEIASLAAPALLAAREGDAVARAIAAEAADELTQLALGVSRQLDRFGGLADGDPLVLSGGLFGSEWFAAMTAARLRPALPSLRVSRLPLPPVTGAYLLGLQAYGAVVDEAWEARMLRFWSEPRFLTFGGY
ncbi:BadF/BadG/BcrA/BcrD ATPase family protein [Paenibacillus methanolicus]|uniref:N-acetylglucosamine kinase-like BadF-type ATPase n=1 Tax=Paenibacillus methanolicus TaxID=582686 RepID=A0A5S5BSN0_9BACL|nr:BadF/BadG/BcrA/BcrD ATPase family protein [Paenibacillus methanolicus]TYP70069.1 N-acetylglucosamine kinase-like BadF-type ATPase [Paenibacillus methanolicus]